MRKLLLVFIILLCFVGCNNDHQLIYEYNTNDDLYSQNMDSAVKISLKLEKIYGLGFYLADGSVEEIRQKFDPQKIDPLFDDYISFKEMASGYQKNNQKIFPRLPKYFQDTLRIRHLKIDINTLSRYIDTNNRIEMRHLELKKNELKELQASKPTK